MSLKKRIEKEFKSVYDMCYTPLFAPNNIAECSGIINIGLKPNIILIIDKAKKEFPKEAKFPYETTVEARDLKYQSWFKKWFGDEE